MKDFAIIFFMLCMVSCTEGSKGSNPESAPETVEKVNTDADTTEIVVDVNIDDAINDGYTPGETIPVEPEVPADEPVEVEEPTPEPTRLELTWSADIMFVNFDNAQELKVVKAVELMKKVIASDAFRVGVINHTHNGTKTFFDNDGFSNEQIYQKILEGAEKIGNTSKNNTLDIELELYYAATSTVGYTYPNSVRVWMNRKFFDRYTSANVAGNLTHEWLHKLGFKHSSRWTSNREYSVPYAVGYLMERLAKTHL